MVNNVRHKLDLKKKQNKSTRLVESWSLQLDILKQKLIRSMIRKSTGLEVLLQDTSTRGRADSSLL